MNYGKKPIFMRKKNKINSNMATTNSKIQGQTFLFTGTITEFTRDEAEALVEANGGKVISGVNAKLNYLVVGEDAGSKLDKAKKLGTVKILSEKEFLKLSSKLKVSDKNIKVSADNAQDKNEILLNLKLADLKKLLKKYATTTITDKILMVSESVQSFDDITSDDTSFFYFSESNGKLIMNFLLSDVDNVFRFSDDLFKDLAKHSKSDFKIVFLDRNLWELSFCVFTKGEVKYEYSSVSDWEDPYYFDDVPYFVKLAKDRGMEMKKNEDGYKEWDSDEVYDLIYDFRDNLVSGVEYLNLAPDWYKSLKKIPN
jgi:hypothetical protein